MFATGKLMGAGGQGGESYWVGLVGDAGSQSANGVAVDSSGNIVSVGTNGIYGLIAKQDPKGALLWQKNFSVASDQVRFNAVCIDASNDIIATGYKTGSPYNAIVMKLDSSGTILWQKGIYGAYAYQQARSVAVDMSGNIIVGAEFQKSASYSDAGIIYLNSSGVVQWQRRLSVTTYESYAHGISFDSSGNVYVAGYYWKSSGGYGAAFLVKYNSSGTFQWKTGLDVTGNTVNPFFGIDVDSSGNIYVCGYAAGVSPDPQDIVVAKYNSSGTLQWARRDAHVSSDNYVGVGIAVAGDGGVYVSGYYKASAQDTLILKYNTSGTLQWARTLYGSGDDFALGIAVTPTNDPVFCGQTSSDGAGGYDSLIAKVPSDGSGTGAIGASLTYASFSLTDAASTQSVITPAVTDTTLSVTVATTAITASASSLTAEILPV